MSIRRRESLGLLFSVALLLTLSVLPWQSDDPLLDAVQDAGHVPCFGLLAMFIWRVVAGSSALRAHARWRSELLALVLTGAIGVLSELLQIRSSRNADLLDLWHDLAGAAAFLLILRVFRSPRRLLRWGFGLAALGLLSLSLWPFAITLVQREQRNAAFPILCDAASPWGRRLISLRHSQLWYPAGERYPERAGIRFGPERHAAMLLRRPAADWRGYDRLVIEFAHAEADSFELQLRIDDGAHDGRPSDRFYRAFRIGPGEQRLSIALSDIESAPATRQIDLARMRGLALFVEAGVGPQTIYLANIRLER